MRQIVNGNEGLNIMLNEIVNYEMNKTIDSMIDTIRDWQKNSDVVLCETVIKMLIVNKSK